MVGMFIPHILIHKVQCSVSKNHKEDWTTSLQEAKCIWLCVVSYSSRWFSEFLSDKVNKGEKFPHEITHKLTGSQSFIVTASFSGIFFTDLFSLIHVLNEDVACVTKPSQLDEMPLSSSPINKLENKFP